MPLQVVLGIAPSCRGPPVEIAAVRPGEIRHVVNDHRSLPFEKLVDVKAGYAILVREEFSCP